MILKNESKKQKDGKNIWGEIKRGKILKKK